MKGRPRKPTVKHIADGTYRADRHGNRVDAFTAVGSPDKPKSLTKEAEVLWDLIAENLPPEIWNKCDRAMIEGCCKWWAIYTLAIDSMDVNIAHKAWTCFMQAAAQIGLSPVARAKLQAPPPKEVDELDQLRTLKVTG